MRANFWSFLVMSAVVTVGSGAFAAQTSTPVGTGNFRRAEAVQAGASARSAAPVFVTGAVRAGSSTIPKSVRVLAVVQGPRVRLVAAPLDKSMPVTKLTTAQANRMGLVTQAQAYHAAQTNGGILGAKTNVRVRYAGLANSGYSYKFTQTSGLGMVRDWGGGFKDKVTAIDRHVSVNGHAESARPTYTSFEVPEPAKKP